jgi:protein-disulfide isomerase
MLRAAGMGAAFVVPGLPAPAQALELASDDGSPIRNRTVDARRLIGGLSMCQRLGSADADVTLVEFFDYNCGYCRAAAEGLQSVVQRDPGVALLLVHFPILSPGSLDAAALQQAVYRRRGASSAYDLHLALYRMRGFVDAAKARASLDPALLEGVTSDDVRDATEEIAYMRKLSAGIGVRATPTFVAGNTMLIGWPGIQTMAAMAASARQCGQARCG